MTANDAEDNEDSVSDNGGDADDEYDGNDK